MIIELPHPILNQIPQNLLTGMLLSGDRILCCSHASVILIDDRLAGICTIAPYGEGSSSKPTLVSLYVLPEYRGRLLGKRLVKEAISYLIERDMFSIHIDALSSDVIRLVNCLPASMKDKLEVVDHKGIIDIFKYTNI